MVELQEIPLELQLREANRRIAVHLSKGCKFPEFLSPMFLWRFPAIMDNQISVNWDTIMGVYNRTPFFPITLINTEILDDWCAHPSIWKVLSSLQHSRHVLAMVRFTLPAGYRGQPAIVFEASFVLIPVVFEVHQEGLHRLSVHACKADILPSTTEGQVPDPATHQWQPQCRSRSSTFVHGHHPPHG